MVRVDKNIAMLHDAIQHAAAIFQDATQHACRRCDVRMLLAAVNLCPENRTVFDRTNDGAMERSNERTNKLSIDRSQHDKSLFILLSTGMLQYTASVV